MRRTLALASAPLALFVAMLAAGCGADEPTAGGPTPEQLEIVKKNEPSQAPLSPQAKRIRADAAANSFGAQ
jgi:hypothetical protein